MATMCAQEREYHRLVAEREKRKSRVLRMGPTSRIRSSIAYNQYVAQHESKTKKKRPWKYKIPRAAALDLSQYPLLVKLDFAGLFLGTMGLVLPYWCSVHGEQASTFGLWSYCEYGVHHCVSVHDNIIPGKDVPVWYFMCQYNFAIGLFMNAVTLTFLTSNTRPDNSVRMSPTVHMAAECFSAIAALEKLVCVYVFASYIAEADFLYTWGSELEYHASFYCAIASLVFDLVTAAILFLEEEIGPAPAQRRVRTEPYAEEIKEERGGVYHNPEKSDTSLTETQTLGFQTQNSRNKSKSQSSQPGDKFYSMYALNAQSNIASSKSPEKVSLYNINQSPMDIHKTYASMGSTNYGYDNTNDNNGHNGYPNISPVTSRRLTDRYASFPFEAYLRDDNSSDEAELFPTIPEENEDI